MVVTACTSSDYRKVSSACPIARQKVDITIPDSESAGTATVGISGRIIRMSYDVPQLDGAVTVTVALSDEDGTSLYSIGSIAENAKTNDNAMVAAATPHGIVFTGTLTIMVTATGAQTGDKLVSVILHFL